jgi:hypothetical protein
MSLNLAVAICRYAGKSFVVESTISLSYRIYGTVCSLDWRALYLLSN